MTDTQLLQMNDMIAKLEYVNWYSSAGTTNRTNSETCYALMFTALTAPRWTAVDCHDFIGVSFICEQRRESNTSTYFGNSSLEWRCGYSAILIGKNCWKIGGLLVKGDTVAPSDRIQHYISNYLSVWSYANDRRSAIAIEGKQCFKTQFLPNQRLKYWILHKDCTKLNNYPKHSLIQESAINYNISNCDVNTQYACDSGICILDIYVCDGKVDCVDHEDEAGCVKSCSNVSIPKNTLQRPSVYCQCDFTEFQCTSGQCVSLSSICDMIDHCNDMSDEINCYFLELPAIAILMAVSSLPRRKEAIDSRCPDGYSLCNVHGGLHCYLTHKWCVYEKYNGIALHCPQLEHLYHCEYYNCGSTMYKCPNAYCVPTYMVCDMSRDCPNGEDETSCSQIVCPGHLKCRGDIMCVHPVHICDGIIQCRMFHDDESYCDVTDCVDGCLCKGHSLACSGIVVKSSLKIYYTITALVLINSYVPTTFRMVKPSFLYYLTISGCALEHEGLSKLLIGDLVNLQKADFSNSNIKKIDDDALKNVVNLKSIDLSGNCIFFIHMNLFKSLGITSHFYISNSSLSSILKASFLGMPSLLVLDLSVNYIKTVSRETFVGLSALKVLNLTGNALIQIDDGGLYFENTAVYLDQSYYCCYVRDSHECLHINEIDDHEMYDHEMHDHETACRFIIHYRSLRVINVIFGSLFVTGCIICGLRQNKVITNRAHAVLVQHMLLTDMMLEVHSISIVIMSFMYEGDYITLALSIREGVIFHLLNSLLVMSIMMSKYSFLLIVINQLLATKYILIHRTMNTRKTVSAIAIGWLLTITYNIVEYNTRSMTIDYILVESPANRGSSITFKLLFIVIVIGVYVLAMKICSDMTKHMIKSHEKLEKTKIRVRNFKTFKKKTLVAILHQTLTLLFAICLPFIQYMCSSSELLPVVMSCIIHSLAILHTIMYIFRLGT